MASTATDLDELFRDESEIEDLIEAYDTAYGAGEPPTGADGKPAKPRERLLAILEELGQARVVALLIEFAQGFARMAQEISGLCAESGIGIDGQIRLPTDHVELRLQPLDAGWM